MNMVEFTLGEMQKLAAVDLATAARLIRQLDVAGINVMEVESLVAALTILAGDGGPHAQSAAEILKNDKEQLSYLIDQSFGIRRMSPGEHAKYVKELRQTEQQEARRNNLLQEIGSLPGQMHPSALAQGKFHSHSKTQDALKFADDETKHRVLRKSLWFALMSKLPYTKLLEAWSKYPTPDTSMRSLSIGRRYDPNVAMKIPLVEKALNDTASEVWRNFMPGESDAKLGTGKILSILKDVFKDYFISSFPGITQNDIESSDPKYVDPSFYRSDLDYLLNQGSPTSVSDDDDESDEAVQTEKGGPTKKTGPTVRRPAAPATATKDTWADLFRQYDRYTPPENLRNFIPLRPNESPPASAGKFVVRSDRGVEDVWGGMILKNTSGKSATFGMVIGYKPNNTVVVYSESGGRKDWNLTSPDVTVSQTQVSQAVRDEYR